MTSRTPSAQQFATQVVSQYRSAQTLRASASFSTKSGSTFAREAASEAIHTPVGHPAFRHLDVGQSAQCDAAVVFADLTDFTGRSFWDKPEDVVELSRAVVTQVMDVITSFGGHVLGLRGDGVFACFGGPDSQSPALDVALALGAAAWTLDATQNALNDLLKLSGIEPVQMRVGADYGRLDFLRTGSEDRSEVNVLGFAANFAAKCEKYAHSWEVVAGETLQAQLAAADIFVQHDLSPKRYTRAGEERPYRFYDVRWRQLLPHLSDIRELLNGAPSSAVGIL